MTIAPQQNCTIIGNSDDLNRAWCAYEHYTITPDVPPELIYIGACKLQDVFNIDMARDNSEWHKLHIEPRPLMIRIIAVGDDCTEIQRFAIQHIKATNPTPRCNLYGYNMHGTQRPVLCSNGRTYHNQSDAARQLGINASHISRHMRGELKHVRGYTFIYTTEP